MSFDHQRDDTAGILRFLEAVLAIFGVFLLAAILILYAYLA